MYLLLFSLWLILNGSITPELLFFGLALTALLAVLLRVLFGYGPGRELRLYRSVPLFLVYVLVLLWKIVQANFAMVRLIFFPKNRMKPALVRVRVPLKTSFARYMLANSITLTPGTITVDSRGDVLTVHCLDPAMLEDLDNGIFVRLLRRMEA